MQDGHEEAHPAEHAFEGDSGGFTQDGLSLDFKARKRRLVNNVARVLAEQRRKDGLKSQDAERV